MPIASEMRVTETNKDDKDLGPADNYQLKYRGSYATNEG